jgi:CheY-like chemotaxis protein
MDMTPAILVVDDDPTNRMVVRLLMEKRGYEVVEAPSGPDALTLITQHRIKVILMDLSMPGMDGFETTRRIKATPDGADIPVIALTAHTSQSDQTRCFEAGMNGILPKPFDSYRADRFLTLLEADSVAQSS